MHCVVSYFIFISYVHFKILARSDLLISLGITSLSQLKSLVRFNSIRRICRSLMLVLAIACRTSLYRPNFLLVARDIFILYQLQCFALRLAINLIILYLQFWAYNFVVLKTEFKLLSFFTFIMG
jgi:hypothetical protein